MKSSDLCCVVNLPERRDRYHHIVQAFEARNEFALRLYDPLPHKTGAFSLWLTLKKILETVDKDLPFFILCEDDHEFTPHYSFALWQKCIDEAQQFDADILCGGVSWFKTGVQVSKNLFWVEKFSGLQFTVIFQKFYQIILNASFSEFDQADYKISDLTEKKFVIYPFMSVQKDFGYSDVTSRNHGERRVERLFAETSERFALLQKVKAAYSCSESSDLQVPSIDIEHIDLPLYIIKKQYDLNFCTDIISSVFSCKTIPITTNHYPEQWKALRNCIDIAKRNEDDFIIVTFQSFELQIDLTKFMLVKTLIKSCHYNCDILLGSIEKFNHAVPVSESMFWIDSFSRSSFIVLFSGAYEKITSSPPAPDEVNIHNYLSYVTSHKIAVYPFIAESRNSFKEFESDIKFQEHGKQLGVYQQVFRKYFLKG